MAETKVNNSWFWEIFWAILIVAGVFAAQRALSQSKEPVISWRIVAMDGHRVGAIPLNTENASTALGAFADEGYVTPTGVTYAEESAVASEAQVLFDVEPKMLHLKQVIGHSAKMMEDLRTVPDLPLGNLVADVIRDYGSRHFGVPMDFSLMNFGGIRIPMPEGAVTLEDISSMFPFKNYLCYCMVKGENLTKLLEQLSDTKAFQAISGARVRVKDHKLESALVGGQPIDPSRVYNVVTIDFLLDGGDNLRVGALSEDVVLSHVLIKDAMMDYVLSTEKAGKLIDSQADGRVVME